MSLKFRTLLILALALAGFAAAAAQEQPASTPQLIFSDYDVLLKRNIFSHEQPRYEDEATTAMRERVRISRRPAEPKVEPDIVLTGIVLKDEAPTAFLENRRSGKAIVARTDDTLAGGKVGAITRDAMEFIAGGKTLVVAIGSNLEGGVSTAKPPEPAAAAAPVPGDTKEGAVAGAVDESALSQIEKLKLRRKRMKEQGQ